ncbi:MAG: sulfite dehydrogenase [Halothiobacillaceae bacterium]|nr:MAG: sulfite dehydrogenase [Halothiobacillaceae bacterium]
MSEEKITMPVSGDEQAVASEARRSFLRKSVAVAGGAVMAGTVAGRAAAEPLAIPPTNKMLGRGVVSVPYGMPSKFEAHVVRRNVEWLTPDTIASISFTPLQDLEGIITPAGLHFERYHGGAVDIDPATHRLVVHGLVDKPMIFTVDDLKRMPQTSGVWFMECPANGAMEWRGVQMDSLQFTHGMISCSEWVGVSLLDLMKAVGVKKDATWFYGEGADGSGLQRSIPLPGAKDQFGKPIPDADKIYKDIIIAYAQNGEALRPENGYPIRIVVPGTEANLSVKHLRRIKFTNKPLVTYQETRHYTDGMPDGRFRQYTLINETNSVVTFPCPDKKLSGKGAYEIRGLAWSGRGKVKAVDVSVDGGKTWKEAKLVDPVLSKCLTRFIFPWEWDGKETLVMSRAMDETGYVQPTLRQLREVRGTNSIYHKNSIQTWKITANGEVKNVQIENL